MFAGAGYTGYACAMEQGIRLHPETGALQTDGDVTLCTPEITTLTATRQKWFASSEADRHASLGTPDFSIDHQYEFKIRRCYRERRTLRTVMTGGNRKNCRALWE